ncbi:hypothetical protein [Erwinia psidii]|uniref:hypothetical protein n=1 Tax=Erwinia psidii TaxID=69224 RepID=UPI0013154F52|nr:hypothetical protein [Erwinia psidii]
MISQTHHQPGWLAVGEGAANNVNCNLEISGVTECSGGIAEEYCYLWLPALNRVD